MVKKLTTLYLEVEQEERLKKLSMMTSVPKAVYTREAVDLVLKKYEQGMSGRLE
jgi:predicted DNA-binding protein